MVDKRWIVGFIALSVVILDQLLKYILITYNSTVSWVFLNIIVTYNTGAGFSILQGHSFFLGILSTMVFIAGLYYYKKIPANWGYHIAFALFMGGVAGNGIDRLLRHYVVDFISIGWWPSFNVADASITCSVVLFVILSLTHTGMRS